MGAPDAQDLIIEAEQQFLATLLEYPGMLAECLPLAPEDFVHPTHVFIFRAILDLVRDGRPPSLLAVLTLLTARDVQEPLLHYAKALVNLAQPGVRALELASLLRERGTLRRIRAIHAEMTERIETDDPGLIAQARAMGLAAAGNAADQSGARIVEARTLVGETVEYIERIWSGAEQPPIPSGLARLDGLGPFMVGDLCLIGARPSVGKCLSPETPVLMFDGATKAIRDIGVGEWVMGPDSRPRQVLSTATGEDEMYRIVPAKGAPWVCNSVHVLSLVRNRAGHDGEIIDLPLDCYLNPHASLDRGKLKLFRVGVEFPPAPAPALPPYLAGVWLGDGSRHKAVITNADQRIVDYCVRTAPTIGCVCRVRPVPAHNTNELSFRHTRRADGCGPNPFRAGTLALLDAEGGKRIAPSYLRASRRERLELLAGLVDTDGHVEHGCIEIITKYPGLRDDLLFLCRSLGLAAYAAPKIGRIKSSGFRGDYWRVVVSGELRMIPCQVRALPERRKMRSVLRTGFGVEPVGRGPYAGFTLDGDGRFLLGDFTVTHNTAFGVQIARHAASKGYGVLIISLEMSTTQLMVRMLAQESQVSIAAMHPTNRFGVSVEDRAAVYRAAGVLEAYPFGMVDRGDLSIDSIIALARGRAAATKLDVLIIDYLQLIPTPLSDSGRSTRNDEVGKISRKLKLLARELNIAVLAMAQLNRTAVGGAPRLDSLRESGNLEQDADSAILMSADLRDLTETQWEELVLRPVFINVAKNRNGPRRSLTVLFNAQGQILSEVEG